jgi:hypothetical protein
MSTCPVLALIIIIIFHSVCNLNVYDSRNITIATFLWRISSDNLQKTKDQTPIIPSSPPIDSNSGQIEIGSSEVSDDAGNDDHDPIVKLEVEYGGGHLKCAAHEENYSTIHPVYLLNHNHANNKAASVELNLTF